MAKLTSDDIKEIVHEIRNDTTRTYQQKGQYYREKYHSFAYDLPKLFDAALRDDFPLNYLDFMLQQIDLLKVKKTNIDSADEVVISKLKEQYVDPLFPNGVPKE